MSGVITEALQVHAVYIGHARTHISTASYTNWILSALIAIT